MDHFQTINESCFQFFFVAPPPKKKEITLGHKISEAWVGLSLMREVGKKNRYTKALRKNYSIMFRRLQISAAQKFCHFFFYIKYGSGSRKMDLDRSRILVKVQICTRTNFARIYINPCPDNLLCTFPLQLGSW